MLEAKGAQCHVGVMEQQLATAPFLVGNGMTVVADNIMALFAYIQPHHVGSRGGMYDMTVVEVPQNSRDWLHHSAFEEAPCFCGIIGILEPKPAEK